MLSVFGCETCVTHYFYDGIDNKSCISKARTSNTMCHADKYYVDEKIEIQCIGEHKTERRDKYAHIDWQLPTVHVYHMHIDHGWCTIIHSIKLNSIELIRSLGNKYYTAHTWETVCTRSKFIVMPPFSLGNNDNRCALHLYKRCRVYT